MEAGLAPFPAGSTFFVASASSSMVKPARSMASLSGLPAPLRLSFGM